MVVHGGIVLYLYRTAKQGAWVLVGNVYAEEVMHGEDAARGRHI